MSRWIVPGTSLSSGPVQQVAISTIHHPKRQTCISLGPLIAGQGALEQVKVHPLRAASDLHAHLPTANGRRSSFALSQFLV